MADILFDGLPVLDLLEITPSTSAVAQLTQRDQSSISRIYRQVSQRLGLEFCKQSNGVYRAGANQRLLEGLRLSSQWLRLHHDPGEPRWLACGKAAERLTDQPKQPTLPAAMVQRFSQPQRLEQLLLERVLDLAVITRASAEAAEAAPAHEALLELPLLRSRHGVELILLRRDLEEQPAITALISSLGQAYRHHHEQHPELEWLG